jgi:hypothetical protein
VKNTPHIQLFAFQNCPKIIDPDEDACIPLTRMSTRDGCPHPPRHHGLHTAMNDAQRQARSSAVKCCSLNTAFDQRCLVGLQTAHGWQTNPVDRRGIGARISKLSAGVTGTTIIRCAIASPSPVGTLTMNPRWRRPDAPDEIDTAKIPEACVVRYG